MNPLWNSKEQEKGNKDCCLYFDHSGEVNYLLKEQQQWKKWQRFLKWEMPPFLCFHGLKLVNISFKCAVLMMSGVIVIAHFKLGN